MTSNYGIDDKHGNQLATGLQEHDARQTAVRLAAELSQAVYLYEVGSQDAREAIAPTGSATFGAELHGDLRKAYAEAQAIADQNDCPCGIWERDGVYTVCELAPDLIEPNPKDAGWELVGVIGPVSADED